MAHIGSDMHGDCVRGGMNTFPLNDPHFEDATIAKVTREANGWAISRGDGWQFFVPADSPIEPAVGMAARFYGNGIGFAVRGLFLAGERVFYRTEAEEDEYREIQSYGVDAADWLRRWDKGDTVWSISMGGLGPGYEQAIQITVAEVLRHLLDAKYNIDEWTDKDKWTRDRDAIEKASFTNPAIDKLGLSGAQWGAAMNLAACIYRRGPRAVMNDERVKDRHIQVSRAFP